MKSCSCLNIRLDAEAFESEVSSQIAEQDLSFGHQYLFYPSSTTLEAIHTQNTRPSKIIDSFTKYVVKDSLVTVKIFELLKITGSLSNSEYTYSMSCLNCDITVFYFKINSKISDLEVKNEKIRLPTKTVYISSNLSNYKFSPSLKINKNYSKMFGIILEDKINIISDENSSPSSFARLHKIYMEYLRNTSNNISETSKNILEKKNRLFNEYIRLCNTIDSRTKGKSEFAPPDSSDFFEFDQGQSQLTQSGDLFIGSDSENNLNSPESLPYKKFSANGNWSNQQSLPKSIPVGSKKSSGNSDLSSKQVESDGIVKINFIESNIKKTVSFSSNPIIRSERSSKKNVNHEILDAIEKRYLDIGTSKLGGSNTNENGETVDISSNKKHSELSSFLSNRFASQFLSSSVPIQIPQFEQPKAATKKTGVDFPIFSNKYKNEKKSNLDEEIDFGFDMDEDLDSSSKEISQNEVKILMEKNNIVSQSLFVPPHLLSDYQKSKDSRNKYGSKPPEYW
ncbi:hypothetical protein BB560_000313 [Smittium megazygosporum]|uniref:Uncharacterized protein n=1 Tax=Smittium megazygosporum TaxID=133381 RepID=A0A2T9ZKM0_9FUNG|nr:hypothetical protein BB560_000313 [Smittium megazygosporum]